jgi:hypothetical protein
VLHELAAKAEKQKPSKPPNLEKTVNLYLKDIQAAIKDKTIDEYMNEGNKILPYAV